MNDNNEAIVTSSWPEDADDTICNCEKSSPSDKKYVHLVVDHETIFFIAECLTCSGTWSI